jgi:hypothetical protein
VPGKHEVHVDDEKPVALLHEPPAHDAHVPLDDAPTVVLH